MFYVQNAFSFTYTTSMACPNLRTHTRTHIHTLTKYVLVDNDLVTWFSWGGKREFGARAATRASQSHVKPFVHAVDLVDLVVLQMDDVLTVQIRSLLIRMLCTVFLVTVIDNRAFVDWLYKHRWFTSVQPTCIFSMHSFWICCADIPCSRGSIRPVRSCPRQLFRLAHTRATCRSTWTLTRCCW